MFFAVQGCASQVFIHNALGMCASDSCVTHTFISAAATNLLTPIRPITVAWLSAFSAATLKLLLQPSKPRQPIAGLSLPAHGTKEQKAPQEPVHDNCFNQMRSEMRHQEEQGFWRNFCLSGSCQHSDQKDVSSCCCHHWDCLRP